MKKKYGDQDEDEREMRLALIGGKQVKDFDIAKHQERKKQFGGKWVAGVGQAKDKEEESEDENDDNNDQGEVDEDDQDP